MQIHNIKQCFQDLIPDSLSDIQTSTLINNPATALIIAELKAGRKLPAHYHLQNSEIYQVLSGNGLIELGTLTAEQAVNWEKSVMIKAGDVFEVPAGKVHRLTGGDADLRLVFITPPAHLADDRYFINKKEVEE